MSPLSVRLAISRFLDPALMLIVVLGVVLYFALRDTSGTPAAGDGRDRLRRRARVAVWVLWGALWALSTPLVSNALLAATEIRGPDLDVALAGKDRSKVAVVVFGGGLQSTLTASPPRERLSGASSQRAITAARVWHTQHLGLVIVSASRLETEGMADLLLALGVPDDRIVREERSLNTRDNAAKSAEILKEKGVVDVVLVTSAAHLRRSLKDFAQVGVVAVPAAADLFGGSRPQIDDLLPSAGALARTHTALHEILGYVRG